MLRAPGKPVPSWLPRWSSTGYLAESFWMCAAPPWKQVSVPVRRFPFRGGSRRSVQTVGHRNQRPMWLRLNYHLLQSNFGRGPRGILFLFPVVSVIRLV
jgi:hypothetical protein